MSAKLPEKIEKPSRNYGVDLLRIVSMLMIIIAHIMTQGGVLSSVKEGTAQYYAAWLLRIFVICDVNCFALISGYAGANSHFKLKRVIMLWFEVLAYSFAISVIFRAAGIYKFSPKIVFLPVLAGRWWYVTAYFGMVLFTPFFCMLFERMSRKQASKLAFLIIFILSVLPTVCGTDLFKSSWGYSMLWISALFMLGAYIKRHEPFKRVRRGWIAVYVLSMLAAFAGKMILTALGGKEERFVSFPSFFVLLGSMALLMFFSRVSVAKPVRKFTEFFAPNTFAVYLIHVHPCVWNYILAGAFKAFAARPAYIMLLEILAAAAVIFFVCAFVDKLRALIFKLLRLNRLAELIGDRLTYAADKIFK